ncbi:signal transduction histidine kinase [Dinghuibacter silviterrae]|uniref:histidine kinase n=2 Tax=Dinghuibacter silviterrae TaxID=1539049 RepID=A0A4R8DIX1_9BACT|nr:signal transduction histidine kinase [Dinghuibacter silviterrae]
MGTAGIQDEEMADRISYCNKLSFTFSVCLIVDMGFVISIFQGNRTVIIAAIIEFILNGSVLLFNWKKMYVFARFLLYTLQCVAIAFFGILFGKSFYLEFTVIFLILINYLVFKSKIHRTIGLSLAMMVLIILEVRYGSKGYQDLIPVSGEQTAFLIHVMIVLFVITIILVVNKPYVHGYDKRYELKRANIELERANWLIKVFVAQMTHELRNELDTIHQVTQLLQNDMHKDEISQENLSLLEIAATASKDARNISNNVLDMAAIETGNIPAPVYEAIRVDHFVQKVVDVHTIAAREKGIQLNMTITGLPRFINTDPVILKQIISNLVSNAIKYSYPDTTVGITFDRLAGNCWEIRVVSHGLTIPKEKLATIFNPFVSLKVDRVQGAGLGLYIVKNKVDAMGGTIEADSNEHGENVFRVKLPVLTGEVGVPELDPLAPPLQDLFKNVHVLSAEDHQVNTHLLERFLQQLGCTVTTVENGRELLDQALLKSPDIIILDCYMPVMNGEQTIRAIKMTPSLQHIPIIAVSADLYSDTPDRILEAGADTFLKKPLQYEILQNAMAQFIAKQ